LPLASVLNVGPFEFPATHLLLLVQTQQEVELQLFFVSLLQDFSNKLLEPL
jgi:hypothetical protein